MPPLEHNTVTQHAEEHDFNHERHIDHLKDLDHAPPGPPSAGTSPQKRTAPVVIAAPQDSSAVPDVEPVESEHAPLFAGVTPQDVAVSPQEEPVTINPAYEGRTTAPDEGWSEPQKYPHPLHEQAPIVQEREQFEDQEQRTLFAGIAPDPAIAARADTDVTVSTASERRDDQPPQPQQEDLATPHQYAPLHRQHQQPLWVDGELQQEGSVNQPPRHEQPLDEQLQRRDQPNQSSVPSPQGGLESERRTGDKYDEVPDRNRTEPTRQADSEQQFKPKRQPVHPIDLGKNLPPAKTQEDLERHRGPGDRIARTAQQTMRNLGQMAEREGKEAAKSISAVAGKAKAAMLPANASDEDAEELGTTNVSTISQAGTGTEAAQPAKKKKGGVFSKVKAFGAAAAGKVGDIADQMGNAISPPKAKETEAAMTHHHQSPEPEAPSGPRLMPTERQVGH